MYVHMVGTSWYEQCRNDDPHSSVDMIRPRWVLAGALWLAAVLESKL